MHVIENLFGHRKTRNKGLAKNTAALLSLFGLAKLFIAKRALLETHARGAFWMRMTAFKEVWNAHPRLRRAASQA